MHQHIYIVTPADLEKLNPPVMEGLDTLLSVSLMKISRLIKSSRLSTYSNLLSIVW